MVYVFFGRRIYVFVLWIFKNIYMSFRFQWEEDIMFIYNFFIFYLENRYILYKNVIYIKGISIFQKIF